MLAVSTQSASSIWMKWTFFLAPDEQLKDLCQTIRYIPWGWTRNLFHCWTIFLIAFPVFLHSLTFLISNCLDLLFGTQGRSRRLKPFLQTRNEGHRKAFVFWRTPQVPSLFQSSVRFLRFIHVGISSSLRIFHSSLLIFLLGSIPLYKHRSILDTFCC